MLVRAKVNFSGAVSMCKGEVKNIKDNYVLKDLICAGYVVPEAQEAEVVEKPVEKAEANSKKPVEKPKTKKSRKKSK